LKPRIKSSEPQTCSKLTNAWQAIQILIIWLSQSTHNLEELISHHFSPWHCQKQQAQATSLLTDNYTKKQADFQMLLQFMPQKVKNENSQKKTGLVNSGPVHLTNIKA